jgi:hypothetical protein
MRHFTIILLVSNFSNCDFSLILCLPFVSLRQKGEEYFLFWSGKVFPNQSSVFCSRMAKGGSLLVFYAGNILDDKNTLCNGYILNRFIDFIQNLQVIWTMFVSSHVIGHKFLEDIREVSMHFPS